jgi:hypothetical protein
MVPVFAATGPEKQAPNIDDIIITTGKTFEEHLTILLEEALVQLGNARFQVNAKKSNFFSKVLNFLALY